MPEQRIQHRDRETQPTGESGFSLVEVLIVVAIIGVLMSIAITSLADAFDRTKQRATMSDMRTISKALEIYKADTGHYPANGQTMGQLVLILIPYQTSVLPSEDAWKHGYTYATDNVDSYSIASYGKDGVDGLDVSYSTRFEFDRDIILSNGLFVASPEG
jgi:general secretion pathway protein G